MSFEEFSGLLRGRKLEVYDDLLSARALRLDDPSYLEALRWLVEHQWVLRVGSAFQARVREAAYVAFRERGHVVDEFTQVRSGEGESNKPEALGFPAPDIAASRPGVPVQAHQVEFFAMEGYRQ